MQDDQRDVGAAAYGSGAFAAKRFGEEVELAIRSFDVMARARHATSDMRRLAATGAARLRFVRAEMAPGDWTPARMSSVRRLIKRTHWRIAAAGSVELMRRCRKTRPHIYDAGQRTGSRARTFRRASRGLISRRRCR